jgi:DNA-binding transcriptional LysR family regulator
MAFPDFNLLITLDAVLAEGSVAGAARRLQLSPSAMSRALARLRDTTGDPLLVRAGRGLVPTPRATELREQVHQLVQDAEQVLRPTTPPNLKALQRTFTIRTREGFAENFAPALLQRIAKEAPQVRLCFQQKTSKESTALRDGTADMETGVIGRVTSPELRAQALFHDQFIAVSRNKTTRYAKASHIALTRHGALNQQIDEALGSPRKIAITVSTFTAALALARATDLVATVPERQTGNLREGLYSYPLPFAPPELTVSLIWHPRMDADPAHRWLRAVLLETCKPTG